MILESGLNTNASFEVQPKASDTANGPPEGPPGIIPVTITPIKANGGGISMELDETGVEIPLADTVPKSPQDATSVNSSGIVDDPMDNIVGDSDPLIEDALGAEGHGGVGVSLVVVTAIPKVVMDTGGIQGDIIGGTSNDNVNDSTKSLPFPVLKGGCRDAHNHSDGDTMITNVAEIEAEANKKSNTTATKSIALLNANTIASVWSLIDCSPRLVAAASVSEFIWRKASTYKTISDI